MIARQAVGASRQAVDHRDEPVADDERAYVPPPVQSFTLPPCAAAVTAAAGIARFPAPAWDSVEHVLFLPQFRLNCIPPGSIARKAKGQVEVVGGGLGPKAGEMQLVVEGR